MSFTRQEVREAWERVRHEGDIMERLRSGEPVKVHVPSKPLTTYAPADAPDLAELTMDSIIFEGRAVYSRYDRVTMVISEGYVAAIVVDTNKSTGPLRIDAVLPSRHSLEVTIRASVERRL